LTAGYITTYKQHRLWFRVKLFDEERHG